MKNSTSIAFMGIVLMAMIYHASSECVPIPAEMMESFDECKKPYFIRRIFGASKKGCMAACLLSKMDLMVDGKIHVENVHKFFGQHIEDERLAQRINERMHHSAMRANTGAEQCEVASIFFYNNDIAEEEEPLFHNVFC